MTLRADTISFRSARCLNRCELCAPLSGPAAPDHPEAAAMAALANSGRRDGYPAAHVLVPETREPIPPAVLLLLIQSAQGQVGCLTALLAPMLDAQRRALQPRCQDWSADAEALCATGISTQGRAAAMGRDRALSGENAFGTF